MKNEKLLVLYKDEVGGDCDSIVDRVDADGRADPETEEIKSSTCDLLVVASVSMSICIIISLVIM